MRGLRAFNMRGINLTIPHKVAVLPYLDEVKPAAALMGAVNTVVRVGDRLVGENTDGRGFMTALTRDARVDPAGKRVVVLGAGGAARSITVELALAGAQRITIVNRSPERGLGLVELLNRQDARESRVGSVARSVLPFPRARRSWSTQHPSASSPMSTTSRTSTTRRSPTAWLSAT